MPVVNHRPNLFVHVGDSACTDLDGRSRIVSEAQRSVTLSTDEKSERTPTHGRSPPVSVFSSVCPIDASHTLATSRTVMEGDFDPSEGRRYSHFSGELHFDEPLEHEEANKLVQWLDIEVKRRLQRLEEKMDNVIAQARKQHKLYRRETNRATITSGHALSREDLFESIGVPPSRTELEPYVSRWSGSEFRSSHANRTSCANSNARSSGVRTSQVDETIDTEDKMRKITRKIESHQHARGLLATRVWRFLENPYSSPSAKVYACFMPLIVVASVFVSFWQTVDGCPLDGTGGEILQTCFEACFATELFVRFYVCPDRRAFWCNLFNYIDFASASPLIIRFIYAIDTAIHGLDDGHYRAENVLSKLSFMPVLRLLKLTRRFEKFQLLFTAFQVAVEALPVLLYTLIVIALLFSAIIYFFEPRSNISSLPRALWFVIVTMTTVGYGDVTPSTSEGFACTIILMVISGLYMAIPIGIVGNAFSQVWSNRERSLLMQRMREAFLHQGFGQKAIEDIVHGFDDNKDGRLDIIEFRHMLESMGIRPREDRLQLLVDCLDVDLDGYINIDELLIGLYPHGLESWGIMPALKAVKESLKVSMAFSAPRDDRWTTTPSGQLSI